MEELKEKLKQKLENQQKIPTYYDNYLKHLINNIKKGDDYTIEDVISEYKLYEDSKENRFVDYDTRTKKSIQRRMINIDYHQGTHSVVNWKGYSLFKSSNDMIIYSMLFNEIKPEIIIELGSGMGGSAVWMADLTKSLGLETEIISYDINKPNIEYNNIKFVEYDMNNVNETTIIPFSENYRGKRKIIIEDVHQNVKNLLFYLDKIVEINDYVILEDSIGKQTEIEEFVKMKPKKYLVDQYYLDFFGINMGSFVDSIFKISY